MTEDYVKGKTARILEFVFGGILIIIGVLSLRQNPMNGITTALLGAFLLICGLQWTALWKTAKSYVALLSSSEEMTIDRLSSAAKETPKEVKENIGLMTKKGVLSGIAIDEHDRRIVISKAQDSSQAAGAPVPPSTAPVMPVQTQAVKCPGCGSVNEVQAGATAVCEHCGSTINGN